MAISLMDADSSIRIRKNGVRRRGLERIADIALFEDRRTQRGVSLDDSREIPISLFLAASWKTGTTPRECEIVARRTSAAEVDKEQLIYKVDAYEDHEA